MQKVQASPLLNLWNAREPGCGGAMAVAEAMRRAAAERRSFIFVVLGLDGGFLYGWDEGDWMMRLLCFCLSDGCESEMMLAELETDSWRRFVAV